MSSAAEDIEGLVASPTQPLLTPTTSKGSVQGGSSSAPGSPAKKPVVVAQARPTWFQKYSFLLYAALLLVSATGNSVFFKKMINKFPNYPYFLSQLTTFVYIPIFWSVVLYEIKFTNFITPAMYKFPKWKFFVMGALDATAGVFMLFGGVHTSGSFQALLLQTVIPITMVLSYLILKERYKPLQYAGAAVIVVGVSFVLVPQVLDKEKSGTGNILIFNIIFLLSNIPSALSNVYKEFAFTEEMDINLLQAWVANWQLVFGLMLSPLNSLKFLGDSYLSLHDLPKAIINGGKCLVGINTLLTNCIPVNQKQIPGIAQCDDCSGGWIMVLFYLLFNLTYNVAIVLVIKYAGANILNFVMTLRLPLVQLAFAISIFNNPPDKFKWPSIVGLIIILCGLVVYRFGSSRKTEDKPKGEQEEEAVMMFAGMEPAQIPVWVKTHVQQRTDPHRIRSGLYARLGVIESPRTNSAGSKRRVERSASGPRKP